MVWPAASAAHAQALSAGGAAQAVLAGRRVDPVPGGGGQSRLVLEEPLLMLHGEALGDRLRLRGTLDFEGWTVPAGISTLGAWGEGFNDRRHPHTYAHEFMVAWVQPFSEGRHPVTGYLAAGKGFVPFGSDDPMTRPPLAYPVNHHWSQILERAVAMAGVRAGPVTLEGSLFNGDEPERPGQWPRVSGRLGDSWSGRLTLAPVRGIELEGSYARVHSPEHRPGAGPDQSKWHASAGLDRSLRPGRLVVLAEWARTSEADGFFVFRSVLAEVAWMTRRHRVYYRFERSDRPEEERNLDPFRSVRPHLENSIIGVTRWTLHTAGYGLRALTIAGRIGIEPIAEATVGRIADRAGGLFDAEGFYGTTRVWSATLALRLTLGTPHRMGRYGIWEAGAGRAMSEMQR